MNNLYGYAMSKFLPTRGFKWIDPKEFDLNKYNSNSSKGCVLEVDLEYSFNNLIINNFEYLTIHFFVCLRIYLFVFYSLFI